MARSDKRQEPFKPVQSEAMSVPTSLVPEATDAALLAVLNAPIGSVALDALRQRAHTAWQSARARANTPAADDDWRLLDGRWQELGRVIMTAQAGRDTYGAPTQQDQRERLVEVRALFSAIQFYDEYQPPRAPKPPVSGYTAVLAFHLSGSSGEHPLETREREEREQELAQMRAQNERTAA